MILSFSPHSGEKVASAKREPDEGLLKKSQRPLTRPRYARAPSPRFTGRGKRVAGHDSGESHQYNPPHDRVRTNPARAA